MMRGAFEGKFDERKEVAEVVERLVLALERATAASAYAALLVVFGKVLGAAHDPFSTLTKAVPAIARVAGIEADIEFVLTVEEATDVQPKSTH